MMSQQEINDELDALVQAVDATGDAEKADRIIEIHREIERTAKPNGEQNELY